MNLIKLILASVFVSLSLFAQTQGIPPVSVVQGQLDAYNAQDVDAFADLFAEDAEIFRNIGDEEPYLEGRRKIRKRYRDLFKENPENKSTLIGRIVQGNYVIDHEWITGRAEELKIVAIYEVQNGLIQRAWFVR